MAGDGFLKSLWEKPIWEGVWPDLDPWDSVCSRTASVEWNVPGKYGPHGELFLFLIQKEPATVPGSETFSPFLNADISTPVFSADVQKCALIARHFIAEEGRSGEMDVTLLILGTNGNWAVQRVQCGKVRVKVGMRTKACPRVFLERTVCVPRSAACHWVVWGW